MGRPGALVAALLFTVLAAPASAYTIASFSLSGITFNDGGTASGTFRIVYGNPLEFSPSAATTAGTILNGGQLDEGAQQINFAVDTEIQLIGSTFISDDVLKLFVHANLNPATLASLPTFDVTSGSERIFYPFCPTTCPSPSRSVTGGSIVTTGLETFPDPPPPPAPTPLPAALPLLVSALGGMGVLGWRRRRFAGRP
jgi:hypothetical protein